MDLRDPISHICAICELTVEPGDIKNIKTKKGQSTLKKLSQHHRDGKFSSLDLEKELQDIFTHKSCRHAYYHINEKVKNKEEDSQTNETLVAYYDLVIKDESGQVSTVLHFGSDHRDAGGFDYVNLCLFCGENASETFKWQQNRMKYLNQPAKIVKNVTRSHKQLLFQAAVWGEEVWERVYNKDLLYLNARYHMDCYMLYSEAARQNKPHKFKGSHYENIMRNLRKEGCNVEKIDESIVTFGGANEDFDYGQHCIVCAKDASENSTDGPTFQIRSPATAKVLVELVAYFPAHNFMEEMKRRVESVDMMGAGARCHKMCYMCLYCVYVREVLPAAQNEADQQYYSHHYKDYIVSDDNGEFDYGARCVICAKPALKCDDLDATDNTTVRSIRRQDTVQRLADASLRFKDKWREQVRARVEGKDLVSLDARYHKACYPQFFMPPPQTVTITDVQEIEEVIYNDMFGGVENYYGFVLTQIDPRNLPNTKVKGIQFDFNKDCFICGLDASDIFTKNEQKKVSKKRDHVTRLQKESCIKTIREIIEFNGLEDQQAKKRIEAFSDQDLVAIGVRYHRSCHVRLLSKRPWKKKDCPFYFDDVPLQSQDCRDVVGQEISMVQDGLDISQERSRSSQDGRDINEAKQQHTNIEYQQDCQHLDVQESRENRYNITENQHGIADMSNTSQELKKYDNCKGEISKIQTKDGSSFDFNSYCFICGQDASEAFIKKQTKHKLHQRTRVQTLQSESAFKLMRHTLACNDIRDRAIQERIGELSNEELRNQGIRYHVHCYSRFTIKRLGRKRGRPATKKITCEFQDWHDIVGDEVDTNETKPDISQDRSDTCQDRSDTCQDRSDTCQDRSDTCQDRSDTCQDRSDINKDRRDNSEDELDFNEYQQDNQHIYVQDWQETSMADEGQGVTENEPSTSQQYSVDADFNVEVPIKNPNPRPDNLSNTELERETGFNFKQYCFICGQHGSIQEQSTKNRLIVLKNESNIKTLKEILKIDDTLHRVIQKRTQGLKDEALLSLGLRYHPDCFSILNGNEGESSGKRANEDKNTTEDQLGTSEDNDDISEDGRDISQDRYDTSQDRYDTSVDDDSEDSQSDQDWHDNTDSLQADKKDHALPANKYYEIEISQTTVVKTKQNIKKPIELKVPQMICNTCLSADRKLYRLEKYAHIFKAVCSKLKRKQTYVCWECVGVLKKIKEFKDRAEKAHDILNKIHYHGGFRTPRLKSKFPESLSTLSIIRLDNFGHNGDTDENSVYQNTTEVKQETINVTSNQILVQGSNCQVNDKYQQDILIGDDENCNEETFDDDFDWNDDAFDQQGEGFNNDEEIEKVSNQRVDKVNEKKKQKDQEIDKSKGNTAKYTNDEARQKYKGKVKRSRTYEDSSNEDDESTDSEPDSKRKKSDDSDDNYHPPTSKTAKETTIKYKTISYANPNEVVKKVAIDPKETEIWMKKERNSEYFKKLKRKCLLCVSKLGDQIGEQHHMITLHKQSPTSHTCSLCKIVFKSVEKLNEHEKLHNFVLQCSLCGYQCYSKGHILNHLQRRHRKTIECLDCGALFGFMNDFYEHCKEHHTFNCDSCNTKFHSKEKLNKHIHRLHTEHRCDKCNKTYSTYHRFQQHNERKHVVDPPELCYCVSCGIQFNNKRQFATHLQKSRAHEAERPASSKSLVVSCPECDMKFTSQNKFYNHYDKYHTNRTFPCSQCDKVYGQKFKLNYHVKIQHEGVPKPRNKMCHFCGRGFSTRRTLIHHIRTHTGERPHKCQYCDASFAQRIAMTTHIKSKHKDMLT